MTVHRMGPPAGPAPPPLQLAPSRAACASSTLAPASDVFSAGGGASSSTRHGGAHPAVHPPSMLQVLSERLAYAVQSCTTYDVLPDARRFSRTYSAGDTMVRCLAACSCHGAQRLCGPPRWRFGPLRCEAGPRGWTHPRPVPEPGCSHGRGPVQGVDLVSEEMQGHQESIDDDLTLVSPPGSPTMAAVLQERLEAGPQQGQEAGAGPLEAGTGLLPRWGALAEAAPVSGGLTASAPCLSALPECAALCHWSAAAARTHKRLTRSSAYAPAACAPAACAPAA